MLRRDRILLGILRGGGFLALGLDARSESKLVSSAENLFGVDDRQLALKKLQRTKIVAGFWGC